MLKKTKYLIIFPLLFILSIAIVLYFQLALKDLLISLHDYFRAHPLYIVSGIAILPLAFFPISPLYILAGAVYGIPLAIAYSTLGVAINISLAYFLTHTFLKAPIERFLQKKSISTPTVPPEEYPSLITATRLMPGIPFPLQNYVLALSNIPFKTYFAYSLPTQMVWGLLFILTSGAIFQSQFGYAAIAALAIIATILTLRVLTKLKT